MLVPLLVMAVAFSLLFLALAMLRMRTLLNERKALAMRLSRVPQSARPVEREHLVSARPAVHRGA
jgi:type IV secretory pathway protease TraF